MTRPASAGDALVQALRQLGYRVHAVPTVALEPIPVDAGALTGFDWVVVTSAAGVRALPCLPAGARWAAVGSATAAALAERGVTADLVPDSSSGQAIADAMPEPAGLRVLLARADAAAGDLPQRLQERGAEVTDLVVYRTVAGPQTSAEPLAAALSDVDLAAVVFASGSAVEGYLRLGGTPGLPAVTIGPRTSEVARRAGFTILAEAAAQSAESLASAVARAVPRERERR